MEHKRDTIQHHTNPSPGQPAAIYCRVSSERQEKERTIESQVAALEKAVGEEGDVLTKRYLDEGYSGAVLERPALDALRIDAKQGRFQRLYIYSPDRLARELMLQLVLAKELKRCGVELVFVSRKLGDSPADQLLFQMLGAISEFERAQILERTRRGRLHKARSGLIVTSRPPYGYRYVRKTQTTPGRLEVDETEAENVRLIFEQFHSPEVEGVRTLAKKLHQLGIRNRSGTTKWAKSTLARILKNPAYIGTTYYNKTMGCERTVTAEDSQPTYKTRMARRLRPREEWIPIPVPPILSKATFARAQRKLKRNREMSPRNTKYSYLLTGLVFCGCNRRMYGDPCHGQPRYRCCDRHYRYPLPRKCFQGSLRSETLDAAVWQAFLQVLQHPDTVLHRIQKITTQQRGKKRELGKRMAELQSTLKTLHEQEERFLEAYGAKVISLKQLQTRQQSIEARRDQLQDEMKRLQAMCDACPSRLSKRAIEAHLSQVRQRALQADFRLRRQLIRLFVDKVTIQGQSATMRAYIPAKTTKTRRIASTSAWSRGRNDAFIFEMSLDLSSENLMPQIR